MKVVNVPIIFVRLIVESTHGLKGDVYLNL